MILGIDTGGTFTDFALLKDTGLIIHKVLSTPEAPEKAILQGISDLGLGESIARGKVKVIHGSTVATNAALEGKGVRTAYITNRGFADVLFIGRQARKELYNHQPKLINHPLDPELCFETGGRLGASGEVVESLTEEDLEKIQQQIEQSQVEAVAINLLFSFLDESFEQQIEQAIPDNVFCSRSSSVMPEYKEYERGTATWLNAWLGPLMQSYLERLKQALEPSPLSIMQSSGGTLDALQAGKHAVRLLLSGPAGGLAAAQYLGQSTGRKNLMTLDMGGTSTDVSLIEGSIQLTNEGRIGDYPVAVPMVDMHTIGAGGGSIAYLDEGGMLRVGPESAGAKPGPACYGQGGTRATVTDAHLVLGHIRPGLFLGGNMSLDLQAATEAIEPIASELGISTHEAAKGIISLADEHMARALRTISIERGHDPNQFSLLCFGGAGGLHVCALAEALGIDEALIPLNGGIFSAFGMLVAPSERQLSRTLRGELTEITKEDVQEAIDKLSRQGKKELIEEGINEDAIGTTAQLDLRYKGQSFTLKVDWLNDLKRADEDFHSAHKKRYGHQMASPVELVNIHVGVQALTSSLSTQPVSHHTHQPKADKLAIEPTFIEKANLYGIEHAVPVIDRKQLAPGHSFQGPALITDSISTTWLESGWKLRVDKNLNLLLSPARNTDHN